MLLILSLLSTCLRRHSVQQSLLRPPPDEAELTGWQNLSAYGVVWACGKACACSCSWKVQWKAKTALILKRSCRFGRLSMLCACTLHPYAASFWCAGLPSQHERASLTYHLSATMRRMWVTSPDNVLQPAVSGCLPCTAGSFHPQHIVALHKSRLWVQAATCTYCTALACFTSSTPCTGYLHAAIKHVKPSALSHVCC